MMGWPTAPSFVPGYNKAGYKIYERLTFLTMRQTINRWRTMGLGLPSISGAAYLAQLSRQPLLYGYSAHVVPRPSGWSKDVHVTGYWFPSDETWYPPESLVNFLQAGPPPIFIGFGSMPIKDPRVSMQMIIEAASACSLRAIVQTGWAGLVADDLTENIYQLDYAPYSWLFPRVAAAIHHGGSGTTAAGLRAGVPALVTPFTFDQGFWGRRLAELGVGLKPVTFRKLSVAMLADSMRRLANAERLRERAAKLGQKLRDEDGVSVAVGLIRFYMAGSTRG